MAEKIGKKLRDFSMDTSEYQKYKKNTLIYAMFSITLRMFYVPLIAMALVIIFLLK